MLRDFFLRTGTSEAKGQRMKTRLSERNKAGLRSTKLVRLLGIPIAMGLAILVTGCAGNGYERSTGESVDDAATTRRVASALSDDATYRYSDVKVTTFKGTVQLSGFVDTDEQRAKAEDIAEKTPGVKDVENRITVK
jgi:hypothetical protein